MLRTSAAQPAGWAASPTLAPSSAPRTETTTAAPAGAPSSPQEVRCPPKHRSFAPLKPNLTKHSYPNKKFAWMLPFMSLNQSFSFNSFICSAGWWFEACGPSNLNGIYYPSSTSVVRYNGIKWYYWKGPNLMVTMTTMMVRPANFRQRDIRWGIIYIHIYNIHVHIHKYVSYIDICRTKPEWVSGAGQQLSTQLWGQTAASFTII